MFKTTSELCMIPFEQNNAAFYFMQFLVYLPYFVLRYNVKYKAFTAYRAKKVSQRNLHITSSNTGRFSKFLHYNILQEICNKTVIPPHLKCVATLPCEIFTSQN